MHSGRLVFAQLMDYFPKYEFNVLVDRYQGNHRTRKFSCYDQFLLMAFAQLTHRESLRDIEICLHAMHSKTYHAGIRGSISKSTLADANEKRPWQIYEALALQLIKEARTLYINDSFSVELENTVYALDSTTIDLCLTLFPWAKFRTHKGGIKLHTLLDLRGNIPSFIDITHAKTHDVHVLDKLLLEPGSIYIMDKAYVAFQRLYRINQASAFFVTRSKRNMNFRRLYSRPVVKETGLRCDQTIALNGTLVKQYYPDKLRRIHFFDSVSKVRYEFLTNNFMLPALTICDLYQSRWQIELFFKWMKQHLRIKAFFGTSENAVKTQIWIAISVYVLVAIAKKRMDLHENLYTILQVLSISLFENTQLLQVLSKTDYKYPDGVNPNQLNLFDF